MKKWRFAIRYRQGGWFSFVVEAETREEAWRKGWVRAEAEGDCVGEAVMGVLA